MANALWFWQDPDSRSVVPLYSLPPEFWHEILGSFLRRHVQRVQTTRTCLLTRVRVHPPPGAPWALLRLSGLRDR